MNGPLSLSHSLDVLSSKRASMPFWTAGRANGSTRLLDVLSSKFTRLLDKYMEQAHILAKLSSIWARPNLVFGPSSEWSRTFATAGSLIFSFQIKRSRGNQFRLLFFCRPSERALSHLLNELSSKWAGPYTSRLPNSSSKRL